MYDVGGVPKYAHCSGTVDFRRRSAFQLASMMGFILNKNDGAFMKRWLSEDEIVLVHECRP